jgi:hypothetical protein
MSRQVLLVSRDATARAELARYLANAGFDVCELDRPPASHDAASLVWLAERDDDAEVSVVESWLAAGDHLAVIVSWRKPALRSLVERFQDRLVVLAPPVFGYQLVDALRLT